MSVSKNRTLHSPPRNLKRFIADGRPNVAGRTNHRILASCHPTSSSFLSVECDASQDPRSMRRTRTRLAPSRVQDDARCSLARALRGELSSRSMGSPTTRDRHLPISFMFIRHADQTKCRWSRQPTGPRHSTTFVFPPLQGLRCIGRAQDQCKDEPTACSPALRGV